MAVIASWLDGRLAVGPRANDAAVDVVRGRSTLSAYAVGSGRSAAQNVCKRLLAGRK